MKKWLFTLTGLFLILGLMAQNTIGLPRISNYNKVDYHGERYIFKFPNGWGASVIRHYGAYCDLNVMMPIEKILRVL